MQVSKDSPAKLKIHLLVPMSGQGTRYQKAGYPGPKPLIPVNGVPMIERLLLNFPLDWPCHFVMADNHRESALESLLKKLRPHCTLTYIPVHSLGPAKAIQAGLKNIPKNEAVFVSYCDYAQSWDCVAFEDFVSTTQCDACLTVYRGFHAHYLAPTPYAYVRLEGQQVAQVKEKGCFTDHREDEYASAGGYYFASASRLAHSIDYQLKHQLSFKNEFYTSLTIEALIQSEPDCDVRVFELNAFFQWGTPQDLRRFEYWERSYKNYVRLAAQPRAECSQVLMPMAGLGTRFKSITPVLKPLIPIEGLAMFRKALQTLPQGRDRTVVVALKEVESALLHDLPSSIQCQFLETTPEGQALSVEAGLPRLNDWGDIIISSCDHGIVLDSRRWASFQQLSDCDAALFTIQDFPGADDRPQAFAYVVPEGLVSESLPFPRVTRVSVKKPISDTPSRDPLLVGSFWFKNKAVLKRGIDQLKAKNIRVNQEFYLDSIFSILIKEHYQVRMIPLEGYLCWGDPDSLAEALYWQEVFTHRRILKRPRFPGVPTHA